MNKKIALCTKCGEPIDRRCDRCLNCLTPYPFSELISASNQAVRCSRCGELLVPGADKCYQCDTSLEEIKEIRAKNARLIKSVTKCHKCGREIYSGNEYCSMCKDRIESGLSNLKPSHLFLHQYKVFIFIGECLLFLFALGLCGSVFFTLFKHALGMFMVFALNFFLIYGLCAVFFFLLCLLIIWGMVKSIEHYIKLQTCMIIMALESIL